MSFFNDFFGKTQQRDISSAYNQSNATINEYGDKSRSAYQAGADKASSYYDPWSQSGRRGQTSYEDSLGLNGAGGSQNALAMYKTARNPYFDYESDVAQQGMDRAANARGALNTGTNALAVARARMGMGYQDYQNWQGQLKGVGDRGFQADSARAGIAQQAGQYAGDSYAGQGQQLAGNTINYGNALAASRNTGINNLMGVAGLGVKLAGAAMTGGASLAIPTQWGGRSPGGVYPGQSWGT